LYPTGVVYDKAADMLQLLSPEFAFRATVRSARWQVQGYSMTSKASTAAMRVSITGLKRKIVFARIGDEVRTVGLYFNLEHYVPRRTLYLGSTKRHMNVADRHLPRRPP
jgi:hypothetical protein